jgi:large subunit ribosomal protein L29
MEIEKVRNLNDAELTTQANQAAEQLFRLRFQKSLGNNEGLKKIQGLRRDIARYKTIARQRALGIAEPGAKKVKAAKAEQASAPKAEKKAAAPKAEKTAAKKTAAKKAPAKKAKKD